MLPSDGAPMIPADPFPPRLQEPTVLLSRRPESPRTGRAQERVAPARGTLKRRIVLHVLRAPHGEIAVALDETRGCAHRRTH
jgi:hypothetical protein